MQCNKSEADRAGKIAVKKFTDKDFAGAKKFALKAQNMNPEIGCLPQFLTALEVFISAEKRINGVIDWYGVLGVDPLADSDTIRKSYKRLALMLHPDKTDSLGAADAFKILSEAWSLLSDASKKIAYDKKRNPRPTANPNASDHQCKPDTFRTVCNHCQTIYQHHRIYLNHALRCDKCLHNFHAVEIPPNGSASTPSQSNQQRQNTSANSNSNVPPNNRTSAPNVRPAQASGADSIFRATFESGAVRIIYNSTSITINAGRRPTRIEVGNGEVGVYF